MQAKTHSFLLIFPLILISFISNAMSNTYILNIEIMARQVDNVQVFKSIRGLSF